jgi:hypothetical protein
VLSQNSIFLTNIDRKQRSSRRSKGHRDRQQGNRRMEESRQKTKKEAANALPFEFFFTFFTQPAYPPREQKNW